MGSRIEVIGMKFNRLTIIADVPKVKGKSRRVIAKCDCGKTKEVNLFHVRHGIVKSCGCLLKESIQKACGTHLLTEHPIYKVRTGIMTRCYNSNEKAYARYGGRGIGICEEWRTDFMAFYNWCIDNGWEKGLEIDRIDNNGNYEPSNCRFVTAKANSRNRSNNVMITYKGETKTLAEWAEQYNIDLKTLWARIFSSKWDIDKSLTTPIRVWPSKTKTTNY